MLCFVWAGTTQHMHTHKLTELRPQDLYNLMHKSYTSIKSKFEKPVSRQSMTRSHSRASSRMDALSHAAPVSSGLGPLVWLTFQIFVDCKHQAWGCQGRLWRPVRTARPSRDDPSLGGNGECTGCYCNPPLKTKSDDFFHKTPPLQRNNDLLFSFCYLPGRH